MKSFYKYAIIAALNLIIFLFLSKTHPFAGFEVLLGLLVILGLLIALYWDKGSSTGSKILNSFLYLLITLALPVIILYLLLQWGGSTIKF